MRNRRVLFILCLTLLMGSSWAGTSLLTVSGRVALADGSAAADAAVEVKNLTQTDLSPAVVTSNGQGRYRAIFLATDNTVVASADDQLQVSLLDADGQVVNSQTHTLTTAEIGLKLVSLNLGAISLTTSTLTVTGRVRQQNGTAVNSAKVVVKNLARPDLTAVEKVTDSSGAYQAIFIDTSNQTVAQEGESIQVEVLDQTDAQLAITSQTLGPNQLRLKYAAVNIWLPEAGSSMDSTVLVVSGTVSQEGGGPAGLAPVKIKNLTQDLELQTVTDQTGEYRGLLVDTDNSPVVDKGDQLQFEVLDNTGAVISQTDYTVSLSDVQLKFVSQSLEIRQPPQIDQISAQHGVVDQTVTLTGTYLGRSADEVTLKLNGTEITPSSWSATEIAFAIPAAAGSGNLVLTVDQRTSSVIPFYLEQTVSALSPIEISNPTDDAITIAFDSDAAAIAVVNYGSTTDLDQRLTVLQTSRQDHYITLTGLSANQTYYFNLLVGGLSVDDQGQPFTFQTSTAGIGSTRPLSGQLLDADGQPMAGARVYLTLTGNVGSSWPLSTLTDSSGNWSVDLANLKEINSGAILPFAVGDEIKIIAVGGQEQTAEMTVPLSDNLSQTISVEVRKAPTVTQLSAQHGVVGQTVTLTGTDLGRSADEVTLKLNGVEITPTSWSETEIAFVIPAAAGSGPLTVSVGNHTTSPVEFYLEQMVTSVGPVLTSNPTDDAITIAFDSDAAAIAVVNYGSTTDLGQQLTALQTPAKRHYINLPGLSADQTYYFELLVGGLSVDDEGESFSFQTSTAGSGSAHVVSGQIVDSDGLAVAGAVVYASVSSEDGQSWPLSALTDSSGNWSVDLANLKNATSGAILPFSSGDDIQITVDAGVDGIAQLATTVSDSSQTIDNLTVSQLVTQDIQLVTGLNLVTLPVDPEPVMLAKDFLLAQSAVKELQHWKTVTQSWDTVFKAGGNLVLGNDLTMALGSGYMLNLSEDATWSITGRPLTVATPLSLSMGLNLVGMPYPSGMQIKTILPQIPNGQTITRWDEVRQAWEDVILVQPDGFVIGQDAAVGADRGYFIQVSQAGSWTPTNVSTAPAKLAEPEKPAVEPQPISTIQSVVVGNLTSSAASLAFTADGACSARLRYGLQPDLASAEILDTVTVADRHLLTLTGLKANQTYFLQLEAIGHQQQTVTWSQMSLTTSQVGAGRPHLVYGRLVDEQGQPVAAQLLQLRQADTSPLLAQSDAHGYWRMNLGNLKSMDGRPHALQSESIITLSIIGNPSPLLQTQVSQTGLQDLGTVQMPSQPDDLTPLPDHHGLEQNFPNPFNPETWLPYRLAQPAEVAIRIYNADGLLVRQLDLGLKAAGYYRDRQSAAYWDGNNQSGERVASGLYFYQILADDYRQTRKMVILK